MSRVTAIISALVICIVRLSWAVNHYRDNAITYKAQRDKNARELEAGERAITDMQMRQRDALLRSMQSYEGVKYAKAENDALRDDVAAGRRRLHTCRSAGQCVKPPPPPAWIMQLDWADTAERDYFTLRERLITMQSSTKNPYGGINEQCRQSCPYRWAIINYCIIIFSSPAEYKCLK